ncbi:MAG: hypothetical protein HFG80_02350 [Eubacterium sp.]|nr:hypothetical protein [Eubacterium sp.]
MDLQAMFQEQETTLYQEWCLRETEEIERKRRSLQEERLKLEDEKRKFEWEKKEYLIQKKAEDRKNEQQQQLFNMKWKMLEDEVKKLASEREQFERDKLYEQQKITPAISVRKGSAGVFFVGVDNSNSLKKRYKDLIKIYHPDNVAGDKTTLQEINSEYAKLRVIFE